jgi:aspartate--ammonia ligase
MEMSKSYIITEGYKSLFQLKEMEVAIKQVKDSFERELSKELNLIRVSAPLFVRKSTGINDNLNGTERPVGFDALDIKEDDLQVVQSLAKWKRMALYRYGFSAGEGLYTDMNAIRRDEVLDEIHSIYVDQWDWEKVINKSDRNEETLKEVVRKIFKVFKRTEDYIAGLYPQIDKVLPQEIFFITSQELEDMFPELTPKQREDAITKDKGAVFVMQIGDKLLSGEKHDGRSPDYDDWKLNGDILFWNPLLDRAFELSSMGIRVDEEALLYQLEAADCMERKSLEYHRMLLDRKLPYTIGGGIGQSRICMYFLRTAHIGEVQSSVWPEEMIEYCREKNVILL